MSANRFQTTLFLALLLSSVTLPVSADDANNNALADAQQPIEISADALDIQDQTGTSIYLGNVEISQGSLSLKGDKITIKHPDRALQSVDVIGQQANFKRFDTESETWVTGQADNIIYNAADKTLLLIGSAKLEQPGKHLITGPELTYDMVNKTLKAQSTATQKERISVTLMPEGKPNQD